MGLLTKASHTHQCEQCNKAWTHYVYSCSRGPEMTCPACSGPPPDPKVDPPCLALYWATLLNRSRR